MTTDSKDKDTNESPESKETAQLNKSLYKGTIKILAFSKPINPFKSNLKRPLSSIRKLDEPKSTLRKKVVDDKDSGVTLQAFRSV